MHLRHRPEGRRYKTISRMRCHTGSSASESPSQFLRENMGTALIVRFVLPTAALLVYSPEQILELRPLVRRQDLPDFLPARLPGLFILGVGLVVNFRVTRAGLGQDRLDLFLLVRIQVQVSSKRRHVADRIAGGLLGARRKNACGHYIGPE